MQITATILVVDDDVNTIDIVSLILKNSGYNVITDIRGDLFFLKTGIEPDLILLDNQLGDKSGADLCSKLKASEQTKHIPVILMSATPDLNQIATKACADDFLTKPFGIQQLLQKVDKALTEKSPQP